jgi:mannose-6-phosphate isomerase-like protein (cupin superfamily)
VNGVVCGPGDGERFEREHRVVTILAAVGELSVLDIAFDAPFAVEPHVHDDHADAFYVLEGEVEFTVGEETVRAGPGTLVLAPPGTRHGFRNPGGGQARVLNLHAPDAGFADAVRGA